MQTIGGGGPGELTKEAEAVSFPSQCSQLRPEQGTDWEQPEGAGREAGIAMEAGIATEAGIAHGGWHCPRRLALPLDPWDI